jgi:hypothetical protein
VTRGVAPWLLGLAAFLLWPAPSALASEVRIEVSARQALVGEPFTVEVTAVLDGDDEAEEPKLPVQGKAEVAGPSLMPMRRMVMHNFNFRTERNLVATYEVTPTQTGRLVLGPASFEVGGKRLQTEALTVEVLDAPPPGSRRSRTLRGRDPFGFGFDPFSQDPFGRDPSGQGPFDGFKQRSPLSGYPEAPADLGLTSAPSETGFLMARLDKQAAWLGESVVLSIYAYGGRGAFRELSPTEPALADFLSYPSVETSHEQPFFRTEIAGREFLVVKLRELVLVPLRTGSLKIGPMRVILRGRGYPSQGSPLGSPAVSLPISLMVLPAPLVGRPPRFRAGDVGQFELSAEVTPREVQEQDFVSVKIQLSGRGNLPSTVEMPEVPGVAWGDPTVRGGVNVEGRELVGTRTLEYTAKLTRPGSIDLGSVSLPHFDPKVLEYRNASAALGAISVLPSAASAAPVPSASADKAEPQGRAVLLALTPRSTSSAWRRTRTAPPLWALASTAVAPGVAWLLALLPSLLAALGRRMGPQKTRRPRVDFAALVTLEGNGEHARVAGELERVIYSLIEDKTGLRARAILKEHLGARLETAGLKGELAQELQALLVTLESARFQSGAESGEGSLVDRAKPIVHSLGKLDRASKGPA